MEHLLSVRDTLCYEVYASNLIGQAIDEAHLIYKGMVHTYIDAYTSAHPMGQLRLRAMEF